MRVIMLPFLILALVGCDRVPTDPKYLRQRTDNPTVSATFLATIDGCRLWNVRADSRDIYFARCDGKNQTQWQETYLCGKATCSQRFDTLVEVSP